MEEREAYKKHVNYLSEQLVVASEFFDCYKAIYNQQYKDVGILNEFPGFFQMCKQSFLHLSSLILSKLFDINSGISLRKCRNILEQNWNEIVKDDYDRINLLKEIDYYLDQTKEYVDKLKTIRDKYLAHNDKKLLEIDNIWANVRMTIGDYHKLIQAAYEIIGTLTMVGDLNTPMLGMAVPDEMQTLFKILENAQRMKANIHSL